MSDQCLVSFSSDDMDVLDEEYIVQNSCSNFTIGEQLRLIVCTYCVENIGQDPDFYSTLPYKHAHATTETKDK